MQFPTTPFDTDRAIRLPGRVNGAAVSEQSMTVRLIKGASNDSVRFRNGGVRSTTCGFGWHQNEFHHVNIEPRKLPLADDESSVEIRAFRDSLYAFFRENRVEKVVIKKRNKKGEYAGGPVGFRGGYGVMPAKLQKGDTSD